MASTPGLLWDSERSLSISSGESALVHPEERSSSFNFLHLDGRSPPLDFPARKGPLVSPSYVGIEPSTSFPSEMPYLPDPTDMNPSLSTLPPALHHSIPALSPSMQGGEVQSIVRDLLLVCEALEMSLVSHPLGGVPDT